MTLSLRPYTFAVTLSILITSAAWAQERQEEPSFARDWTAEPWSAAVAGSCPATGAVPRALLAGDSWAQYMWDDDSHNDIFDKFGHADKRMISRSLDSDPGPGYTGPEYAISGSEARQWADTVSFPWIANMVADLTANPTVDTVVLSIGGNDVLAGRSDGGWYKDMDLDAAGSEAALFATIEADTSAVMNAALAAASGSEVLLSSYEYPNFNVSVLWCWIYACPKRRDLSRDPDNDLITDVELNGMMSTVEAQRVGWTNAAPRVAYDHAIGLMHFYYGDGVSGPGVLPYPGQTPPLYTPFPGGNPARPTLRENFRPQLGLDADPIHLDYDGYQYKITNQTSSYFLPKFRGTPTATFFSQGGANDGWTDGSGFDTDVIRVGDDGGGVVSGIVSFDTAAIPDGAVISAASLYLLRDGATGTNPFLSGDLGTPSLDVARGSFGAPGVEPGDALAPATATNAGCFVGTARDTYYAVRVDLTPAGLAAINDQGLTQFRLAFPGVDPGADAVDFKDGDAVLLLGEERIEQRIEWIEEVRPDGTVSTVPHVVFAIVHQGLGELMGTPAPFLDVTYTELSPDIFADGFESGTTTAWSATVP